MATSAKQRAERMFEAQARDIISTSDGSRASIVLCPRCRYPFDRNHLTGVGLSCCDTRLTVEDAPTIQEHNRLELPGSSRRVLTCSSCNNGAGDTFENVHGLLLNELIPNAQRVVSEAGHTARRLACPVHGSGKPASVSVDLSHVFEAAESSRVMELKEAYIIAFAALGYSYIMCSELEIVRHWIRPGAANLPVLTCAPIAEDVVPARHVAVVSGDLPCVAVSLPAHHAGDGPHAVLLPRPGSVGGVDFYEQLIGVRSIQFTIDELAPWPKSGYPDFHWDRCAATHPRSNQCWGNADFHFDPMKR